MKQQNWFHNLWEWFLRQVDSLIILWQNYVKIRVSFTNDLPTKLPFSGFSARPDDDSISEDSRAKITGTVRGGNRLAQSKRSFKIIRNAAKDLFFYYDLVPIPAQFWSVLEKTHDPVEAFCHFIQAFGCNPKLIQIGNVDEISRAQDMLYALSLLQNYDIYLSDQGRKVLLDAFFSGNFDAAQHAVEICDKIFDIWHALDAAGIQQIIAPFKALLESLERKIQNPLSLPITELDVATSLVREFLKEQKRIDHIRDQTDSCISRFEVVGMPSEWSGTEQKAFKQLDINFNHVLNTLESNPDLSINKTHHLINEAEGLYKAFAAKVAEAEFLYAKRKSSASGSSKSSKTSGNSSRTKSQSSSGWSGYMTEPQARTFMGFSKDETLNIIQIKKRYRQLIKKYHPDKSEGNETPADKQLRTENTQKLNISYNLLKNMIMGADAT